MALKLQLKSSRFEFREIDKNEVASDLDFFLSHAVHHRRQHVIGHCVAYFSLITLISGRIWSNLDKDDERPGGDTEKGGQHAGQHHQAE